MSALRTSVALAAAASFTLPAAAGSLADAMDAAPADAEVVVAFPSMQGFSSMVARLAEATGLDDEGTDDLLGGFKREFGMTAGVDDAGAGLLVLRGLNEGMTAEAARMAGGGDDDDGEAPDPVAWLVVPVTDYEAFVGGLEKPGEGDAAGAAAMPEGVTAVMLDGSPSAVRKVGGHAVLSERAEDVAAYEAAGAAAAALETVGGYAPGEGEPDAAVYVNVAALREGFHAVTEAMVAEAADAGPMQSDPAAQLGAAFAPLYARGVDALVASVDGLLVTAEMTPDRVSLDAAMAVKAGSPAAAYLTDGRSDPLALLASLPDEPFLTAQVSDLSAIDLPALLEAVAGSVREAAAAVGANGGDEAVAGAIAAAVDTYLAMVMPAADATAYAQVNYASDPQAMMTGGIFQTLTATAAPDPAALRAAFPRQIASMEEDLAPALAELMTALQAAGDAEDPPAEVAITSSFNADALTLAGTPVDQYQVSVALPPEALEGMGQAGFLMGNAGMSGFAAAADGVFLQTASAEPAFMEKALLARRGGDAATLGGNPSLAGAPAALPDGLVSAGYLSLQGLAEMANPFMMMFMAEAEPLDVPAALPPVAMGIGMEPAAGEAAGGQDLGIRLNVPVEMLEFVRDTWQRMAPAAAPEQPRGGGAGAPPAPF
ncbi:hypothetical protein [Phycisphaera mikurensis]|uniref:DUF3352 domain-containing protein n=1 Tax=Phycisphaera mikurensis (strain NBRC 102666 / KCTC 22515 / FYK2301M01) TaxID=1142394 RepID=I0IAG4_PHYMF|nr:hypothetical protein [Phycisphaera mikurensis]MBB6441751.1 hypothetical protein [Phycisphaera mikurensis]BAM02252.1 hypothetical protein PSMK_00930 [Phycisphaera mikurensis NBRC 102666]